MSNVEHEALGFLKSMPRQWAGTSRRDCKTYEDRNIDKLSGFFAVLAARFLKAFTEVHGGITITSAHRTAQEQACVCEGEKGPCAGRRRIVKVKKGRQIARRGTSRHQLGIALDVRAGTGTKTEYSCMHEFAQSNPSFGVHFPLGMRDKPHLEPVAKSRGHVRLAALGAVQQAPPTPCKSMKLMLTNAPAD
jgi:hypothetical protein